MFGENENSASEIKRNPWLAVVLNIILFGLGYVYLGKRMVFGILIIFSEILAIAFLFANTEYLKGEIFLNPLVLVSVFLFVLAISYDVYSEAKAIEEKIPEPETRQEEEEN